MNMSTQSDGEWQAGKTTLLARPAKSLTQTSYDHKPLVAMVPNGIVNKAAIHSISLVGGICDAATTAAGKSLTPAGPRAHETKVHQHRLQMAHDPWPRPGGSDLSLRQMQILELLCQGKTVSQIGRSLGLSFHTVRTHVTRSYQKMKVANRTAAVVAFLNTKGAGNKETRNSVEFCPSCGRNLAIDKSL